VTWPKRLYAERHRFLALRACLTILRGGSVAWNLDITDDGFESRRSPFFMADCTDHGNPVTSQHISHSTPKGQQQ
jgi:hypothetical protein